MKGGGGTERRGQPCCIDTGLEGVGVWNLTGRYLVLFLQFGWDYPSFPMTLYVSGLVIC